jgi:sugar O-acyltransferase (sialic acid O-acetyltransferase NeuD family)
VAAPQEAIARPQKIAILCAGQSARLLGEILRRVPRYSCVGYLDGDPEKHGKVYYDLPVLGGFDKLAELGEQGVTGAIPVLGPLGLRLGMFELIRRAGMEAVTVVEPSVVAASDLRIGEGSLVSFGTVILNNVSIARYAFVGSGVNVLHDVEIGANCVIGGGTTIGSTSRIGPNFACGVGCVIRSGGVTIGENVQLAAGTVILQDVPDNSFAIGNPGRVIRTHSPVEVRYP